MTPRALVLTAPGINCDLELVRAFECAGAQVEAIPFQQLARSPSMLDRFDLFGLPGGFSFGDDIAAGRVLAVLIRKSLYPALHAAIERGCPMIAPCNGFQIAVQCGLLPGPDDNEAWPLDAATPKIALAENIEAIFSDRWTSVEVPAETRCVWTQGLRFEGAGNVLPSAHGEGRLVATASVLDHIERTNCVALRYGEGENFNGSDRRIAGICDASGLVFGLMPHPERFTRWTQHPQWTRLPAAVRATETPGLQMFKNAVAHAARVPA